MTIVRTLVVAVVSLLGFVAGCDDKTQYEQGVSDAEIKIGNTSPYSGPASAYGVLGRAAAAYYDMINDRGGINGRKINFVSLDDGYSPPKTVEQIRKLVEEEKVLLLSGTVGTPTNSAVHEYINANQIPHILILSGAAKWGDPKHFPWTMGWNLSYVSEAKIYAHYILQTKPDAKIAVLYQNDDYGKDYVHGLKLGLGDKAESMIIAEASYEVTDPTVDSQIISLKASGADTLVNVSTAKFSAQAIRQVYDIGWRPLHILNNVSSSVGAVLNPAGLEKSVGLITAISLKDPSDPQWKDFHDVQEYISWMEEYYPEGNLDDINNVAGYSVAWGTVKVLEQCGDDLSRTNVMKQAAWVAHREEDIASRDAYLNEALEYARDERSKVRFLWYRNVLSELLPIAMERNIHPDMACQLAQELSIAPRHGAPDSWPWPVKITTLGRFDLLVDGQCPTYSRKLPKKVLSLLKVIIAYGGRGVSEQKLVDALWPDTEGDAAQRSLTATLHRLRNLLGNVHAIQQNGGEISLNSRMCWVDAFAFEALLRTSSGDALTMNRVLTLYRGTFLISEDTAPWVIPMRERLRTKFTDAIGKLGTALEQDGRAEEAITAYTRGIETDNLIESFYQGLMRCHDRLGRHADAVRSYQRLRDILSVALSVKPSQSTRRLLESLRQG